MCLMLSGETAAAGRRAGEKPPSSWCRVGEQ